ncbi:stage II sporulation protein P [Viridibacillus arvi]|uniref:stage II sporulation protein P n=1 Tax=Viridibacillus arvi TaxID=263475 RepID=UPI00187B3D79|nr:stage II sporulation protein P [Viridibacillus sp. JNUCC-6]QOV12165.1 stage II sporulation protein P [Viridibacillus sp. JNUCC-6]
MQNDKDLFDLIKKTYPLNPRPDFVSTTEAKLRQNSRKLNRKKAYKRLSIAFSGLIICAIAIFSIISFKGISLIDPTLSSIDKSHSANVVNKQEPSIYIYQPSVYIYHSHNYESFYSEIDANEQKRFYDEIKNIKLVGKRLSKNLNATNIRTIQESRDITSILKDRGLALNKTYTVSREILEDTLKKNKNIQMVFDIHRDSADRDVTTINIKGKDFAKVEFVISKSNVNYEKNLKFANRLHNKIEKKYPGLSRGVVIKNNPKDQSTYNQDLVNNMVLLQIGGVENTLQEEYRTTDIFAEILKEIIDN